jgi:hypothetical protein
LLFLFCLYFQDALFYFLYSCPPIPMHPSLAGSTACVLGDGVMTLKHKHLKGFEESGDVLSTVKASRKGLLFWRAWLIVSSVGCVVEQLSLFIWILGRFLLDFGGISV